jgi:hypothetical protein
MIMSRFIPRCVVCIGYVVSGVTWGGCPDEAKDDMSRSERIFAFPISAIRLWYIDENTLLPSLDSYR